jgi:hypothetical protein
MPEGHIWSCTFLTVITIARLIPTVRKAQKQQKNKEETLKKLYNNLKEARWQIQIFSEVDRQDGGAIIALGWVLLSRNLHRQLHLRRHEYDQLQHQKDILNSAKASQACT